MNKKPVRGDYVKGSPEIHPGMPVGNDRVPAWLAPNEFVVNQEAVAMYGPQIEAMNNHGRAVQAQNAQAGNSTPPVPPQAQYLEAGGYSSAPVFPVEQEVPAINAVVPPVQVQPPVVQQVAAPVVAPTTANPVFQDPAFMRMADRSGLGAQDFWDSLNPTSQRTYKMRADAKPAVASTAVVPPVQNPPAATYDMWTNQNFGNYANSIASIESSGYEDPYSIYGGYNNHYVGKYQLGAEAIKDSAEYLGMETVPTREEVRLNPELQESLFNAFTKINHETLSQMSGAYRNMSPQEQQRYLGYAHNQGAGGALKYINTGVVNSDGWGTAGTKYMTAVARGQGADWAPSQVPAGQSTDWIPTGFPEGNIPDSSTTDWDNWEFEMPSETSLDPSMGMAGGLNGIPEPQMAGMIPQGEANPVFQDPAFMRMAERSGLGAKGYWDSLDPATQRTYKTRASAISARESTPTLPTTDPNIVQAGLQMDVATGDADLEADYKLQNELDRISLQLQVVPRDSPGYKQLMEQRSAILNSLGRSDPADTGSIVPNREALGTDILENRKDNAQAVQDINRANQNLQQAAANGDGAAALQAEREIIEAEGRLAQAEEDAKEMVDTRAVNALDDQNRQNAAIQTKIAQLDAIAGDMTTPAGIAAVTAARDEAIELGTVPPLAPAGQGDNIPAFTPEEAAEMKSTPPPKADAKASPETVTKVTEKVDAAVAEVQGAGDTVPTNLTSKDATAAGNKAATDKPSLFGDALGFVKDLFGDLLDTKELKRMAILYLGARVTGASGAASIAFAGKSYLSRVDAKETAYNKVAAGGKYTKESVDIFKKTRDYNDLALKGLPPIKTGVLKTFYDDNDKEVMAEKVKIGENHIWIDKRGKQINPLALSETKPADREAQIMTAMTGIKGIVGDLRKEYSYNPESNTHSNKIMPSVDARKIAEWAVYNNVAPEKMGSVIDAAYHDMMNDKGGGREVSSLVPYIRQNVARQLVVGNAGAFVVKPASGDKKAEYIAAHLLETLNFRASKWLSAEGMAGGVESLSNQFYTAALEEWNELTADEKKKYNDGAGEGANGFYAFADTWLHRKNF